MLHRLLLLIALLPAAVWAQTGGVGIGILNPDSSALLHLESTERGFLPPRMTTAQRDVINGGNFATGLIIYNTDDSLAQYWNGACWLPFFLEDCGDCYIEVATTDTGGTIDRTVSDSIETTLNITQLYGDPQVSVINLLSQAPLGVEIDIKTNPVFSTGSTDIVFRVSTFTPGGVYPMIFQVFCGVTVQTFTYVLEIVPCLELDVINNIQNYNLATDVSNTFFGGGAIPNPVCVTATVDDGVIISSAAPGQPAFTTGTFPAGSIVGVVNNGEIIGAGGDGGDYFDFGSSPPGVPDGTGEDGGDALNLTLPVDFINGPNGYLLGGGGGGGAGGTGASIDLVDVINDAIGFGLLPGSFNLCLIVGAGGGGGAGNVPGEGGDDASSGCFGLVTYEDGTDGTSGPSGSGGVGGNNNIPITFPLSIGVASIDISLIPAAVGGNGGNYGLAGGNATFAVDFDLGVSVVFPPINLTIFNDDLITILESLIPGPDIFILPVGGQGGNAVRRNGNPFNFPDGFYNTQFIKGDVSN